MQAGIRRPVAWVVVLLMAVSCVFFGFQTIARAETTTRTTTLDLSDDDALTALEAEDGVTLDGGVYTNTAQGWSYDTNAATKILTLSGVYIQAASGDDTAYGIHLPADSKIVLVDGTTNIVNSGDTSAGSSAAVFADGDLTIDGGGTLIATGGSASEDSFGISSYGGAIVIDGGTITATGGSASNESIGIYAIMDQDGSGGVIDISVGTVSATGGAAKGSSGISVRGNNANGGAQIIVSGGEITALGGASSEYQAFGICAKYGSITISGDVAISATAGDSGSNSYGIYADVNTTDGEGNGKNENDGIITISGGEITALGGNAGSSYGIFAVGNIAINECTVDATGGTSTNVGTTGIASEAGGITINGTATTVSATGGDAMLPAEHAGEGGYANSMGIYALGGEVLIDGNAVVNASGGTSESESVCGIHLNKSFEDGSGGILTITGDARVTAFGGIIVNMQNAFGGAAFIVSGNANVDVSAADITESENSGISMTNGYLMISENAAVTINTGDGKYGSFGIFLGIDSESAGPNAGENDGKLIMTGGTLEAYSATARNSRAIVAQSDIDISGGTVVAQSGEATEGESTGIFSGGEISISGSADVTAQSGSGITLSAAVYADGGVALNSALVILRPEGGGVSADGLSVAAGVDDDYATDVHIAAPSLPAPTGLTAASASYNSIKLTWNAVTGANGYRVYRATSQNGSYTYWNTTSRTFTDTGRTTGTTYYYKVQAYKTVSGSDKYGAYSAIVSAAPVPAAPTGFKAASASYSSIKLSWNAVTGANGYKVWRATSKTGTYSYIKITTSRTFTDTGRTTGKTYYYKVQAYRTVSGVKKYGTYSAISYAKPTLSKVSGLAVKKVSSTSARISYSKTSGASGYEIYRHTSKNSTYVLVRRTTARSWTNTGLKKGYGYYYKVRAYRTVSGSRVYGSYSVIKNIKM